MKERIHERTHPENHAGMRSHRRRIAEAVTKLKDWRNEPMPKSNSLCFPKEPKSQHDVFPEPPIPEDEEISLFYLHGKLRRED